MRVRLARAAVIVTEASRCQGRGIQGPPSTKGPLSGLQRGLSLPLRSPAAADAAARPVQLCRGGVGRHHRTGLKHGGNYSFT